MITFHYIPHKKLLGLNSQEKIRLILNLIEENHIIIIEGRLKSTEEALLIRQTMKDLSENLGKFNGIEMGVFYDNYDEDLFKKIRIKLANWLVGERSGLTIIGPAKIISELKQHPEKIEMHFQKEFFENNHVIHKGKK